MAAVIRYLSADNHTADTPSFSGLESGRHIAIMSLFHRAPFKTSACQHPGYISINTELVSLHVRECEHYKLTGSKSSKKYSCSPVFLIYIYIAFTCTLYKQRT